MRSEAYTTYPALTVKALKHGLRRRGINNSAIAG